MLQHSDLDVRCYRLHRSMATELEALSIIFSNEQSDYTSSGISNDFKLAAKRY